MSFPEGDQSNAKEALLKRTTYISSYLADYPGELERWTAIESAGNYVQERIAVHEGVSLHRDATEPFVGIMAKMGILNPNLPLRRNTELTLGLIYIGYEAKNSSNLDLVIRDVQHKLKEDKYTGHRDYRLEPEIFLRHRTQQELLIDGLLHYGMDFSSRTKA